MSIDESLHCIPKYCILQYYNITLLVVWVTVNEN